MIAVKEIQFDKKEKIQEIEEFYMNKNKHCTEIHNGKFYIFSPFGSTLDTLDHFFNAIIWETLMSFAKLNPHRLSEAVEGVSNRSGPFSF